jgi:hypothetical protein
MLGLALSDPRFIEGQYQKLTSILDILLDDGDLLGVHREEWYLDYGVGPLTIGTHLGDGSFELQECVIVICDDRVAYHFALEDTLVLGDAQELTIITTALIVHNYSLLKLFGVFFFHLRRFERVIVNSNTMPGFTKTISAAAIDIFIKFHKDTAIVQVSKLMA